MDNIQENLDRAAREVPENFQKAHEAEENAVERAKDAFKDQASKLPVPTPPASVFHSKATAHELKSRLNWGEPNLTILDIRDREVFDDCHILGALNTPIDMLPDAADISLQHKRDIYLYGESNEQSQKAAEQLRQAGFQRVAELQGGLQSWMEIGGSIDGSQTQFDPGPEAYNVFSRLKAFSEVRAKEQRMK
ncbi:MAG: rhodanese-like domain-containing protein [Leptolyngbyaceae cyanobacterium bins.302]|nr:rhodanese-like domain-containing protein [Leptolyngbyaceae cyanobacterium bins.302]